MDPEHNQGLLLVFRTDVPVPGREPSVRVGTLELIPFLRNRSCALESLSCRIFVIASGRSLAPPGCDASRIDDEPEATSKDKCSSVPAPTFASKRGLVQSKCRSQKEH